MTEKVPKKEKIYECKICDFVTLRKSHYDRHLLTAKHQKNENSYKKGQKSTTRDFICICGKTYIRRQNLYSHKKTCIFLKNLDINYNEVEENNKSDILSKENIINLVSENNDIKNLLLEQQKQLLEQQKQIAIQQKQLGELIPNVGNTINNTANIKQKFNINIFLNEKCKDALNMDEFIEKMQLTLNNLNITKNKGYVEGISNIFIENMNKLSLYERPLHCTDTKRDTLYIKDKDAWERDKDKTKIKDALKNLNKNHFKLIKEWMDKNPDFKEIDEKQDYFAQLLKTCGRDLEEVSDKVIKKICTSAYLKDELKELHEKIIE
tara:strand:- start:4993 stop:5958 length:966 start_codon:yes stop_codon:yes gene_type:complete